MIMMLAGWCESRAWAAQSKITISQAAWFPKIQQLKVKVVNSSSIETIELYDINGRRLSSASGTSLTFTLGADQLSTIPCAVRVQAGDEEATLPVKAAPKACARISTCKITAPHQGAAFELGKPVHFQAAVTTKDKTALPLIYEWNFGGGSTGVDTGGTSPVSVHTQANTLDSTVSFVLDNTTHRVRFSATDAKGRRCEDAMTLSIGKPPLNLPPKVIEQETPHFGAQLDNTPGKLVVLPFEDWTMQADSDADFMPNLYNSMSPTIHNLRAMVYKKDRLPLVVSPGDTQIQYSAASNPTDPVGSDSINSTSQNWPLNSDIVF